MRKIKIITDSAVDLPKELLEKHNIDVVPFYILFDEESYRDGLTMTTEQMYEKVKQTGNLPKTAAVSPHEWKKYFDKYVEKDMDVFCLTLSSGISANYQNAFIASEEYEPGRVIVVDSKVLSGSIALLTLKAAKFVEQGLPVVQVKKEIERLIPKTHTQFVIRTLDYLYKGGRCSATAKLFGTMLSIKPMIKMFDGKLDVYKKSMGKMSRAVDIMLADFFKLEEKGKLDKEFVFITHSIAPAMEKYIKEEIAKRNIEIENLIVSHAGAVISSHCGEGTIGILYVEK